MNRKDYLKNISLSPNCSLETAMRTISETIIQTGRRGFLLVVNKEQKLLGVVSDGDIRRSLLMGHSTKSELKDIMNSSPETVENHQQTHRLLKLFERGIRHVPVLSQEGHVKDLILYSDYSTGSHNEKPKIVRSKAPVRISFTGGGTDLSKRINRFGKGAVLSSTIQYYAFADLYIRDDQEVHLKSIDFNSEISTNHWSELDYGDNLDLIKAAVKVCEPEFGFDLCAYSDVKPGSGLGGSAAMAAAIISCIKFYQNGYVDKEEIVNLAFQAERIELGIKGGWQDQYATVFGGANSIFFEPQDVYVRSLHLKEKVINELEGNIILCSFGASRNSGEIHGNHNESTLTEDVYNEMVESVNEMETSLMKGQLHQFGEQLKKSWELKKSFSTKVSNTQVDEIFDVAYSNGALGGKLCGAGQAGHAFFYVEPQNRFQLLQALKGVGVKIETLKIDLDGLQTWVSPHSIKETFNERKLYGKV